MEKEGKGRGIVRGPHWGGDREGGSERGRGADMAVVTKEVW